MKKLCITKSQLLSEPFLRAMAVAYYRMGHNRRYEDWSDKRRTLYALNRGFEAVTEDKK